MKNSSQYHIFDKVNPAAERGTRMVMWITAVVMMIEVAAGWGFNSMALLADGWNMGSHAVATGLSVFAYRAARYYDRDPSFAFGTWKIEVLSGFAGAILLLMIAALMVFNSIERFFIPQHIHYQEAITIATLGFFVNILCAIILGKSHDSKSAHDLNLKSVYIHVISDAATSVLAIVALLGGLIYGCSWLDPIMGVAGSILIALWSKNLIIDTAKILLDREMDHPIVEKIRKSIEISAGSNTVVTDLHIWRVGKNVYSCALSLTTHDKDLNPIKIREYLAKYPEVVHSTIEIHKK
jgi:cation diffusion facilitator family transporter